jgi:hypothetical protein
MKRPSKYKNWADRVMGSRVAEELLLTRPGEVWLSRVMACGDEQAAKEEH